MLNNLHEIRDKKVLINKLFKKDDLYGIFINVYLADSNSDDYDEIEYFLNGKRNTIPFIWISHFVDEILI